MVILGFLTSLKRGNKKGEATPGPSKREGNKEKEVPPLTPPKGRGTKKGGELRRTRKGNHPSSFFYRIILLKFRKFLPSTNPFYSPITNTKPPRG